jgi:hypothetical protein
MALARTPRRAPIAFNKFDFSSLKIWGTNGEWWRKQDGVES